MHSIIPFDHYHKRTLQKGEDKMFDKISEVFNMVSSGMLDDSVILVAMAMFFIPLCAVIILFTLRKEDFYVKMMGSIVAIILLIFIPVMYMSFQTFGDSFQILIKPVGYNTYINKYGNIITLKEKIPDSALTNIKYEFGSASGYAIRGLDWVYVMGISDKYDLQIANYDLIIYQTKKQLFLATGRTIKMGKESFGIKTREVTADYVWRKYHSGKIQNTADFFVWPKGSDESKGKIIRYTFI